MPSSGYDSTRVVQISNVSPSASREQLYHMFGYFGRIDEMKVFPSETSPLFASATSKICFIKYDDYDSVDAAQHMTNTVFIDRALVCVPVIENRIPEEETAMKVGAPALGGQRQLPPNLVNQIQVVGSQQLMVTIDPSLAALGLPPYPPLPANTDAVKMEEIRRTVYVGNIPRDVKPKDIVDFFNERIGEVTYLRMAGDDHGYAYVEFTNQHSVPTALQNNGIEFMRAKLRIQHSTVAIIKPLAKTVDMAKKEVEDALKNAEATNPTLGKGMDVDEVLRRFTSSSPLITKTSRSPSNRIRSRSRSRGRSSRVRSRSRSKSKRESSRIPSRRKSRSRSETRSSRRRYRSKSRSRDRSRSRNKRPMRSPSRSKSREREDRYISSSRRRSRSRSKARRREKVEERSSRRERDERERDRDRDRDSRRERDRTTDKVRETKDRDGKNSSRRGLDDDKDRKRKKRSRSRSREKEASRSERDKEKSSKRKNVERESPAVSKSTEEPSEKKSKTLTVDDKLSKSGNDDEAVYGPIVSEDIKNPKPIVSDSEPVQESLQDLFTTAENFISHIKTEGADNVKQEIAAEQVELKTPSMEAVPLKSEISSSLEESETPAPSKESTQAVERKSSSKVKKEKSKKRDKKKKKSSKSSKKRKRAESSSSSSPSISSDTDEGSPEA